MATGLISQQNSSDSSVQLAFNDLPPSEIGQQRMHSTAQGAGPALPGQKMCKNCWLRVQQRAAMQPADVLTVHLHNSVVLCCRRFLTEKAVSNESESWVQ